MPQSRPRRAKPQAFASTSTASEPLRIQWRPLDALIPYANNARTHTPEQINQLAASIREFGWTNPILVDRTAGIIAGHGRVLAARQLGMLEVPCIELAHLSQAQRRAYVLADNKLAENAGWDAELLRLELGELKGIGFDLAPIGFTPIELDALFAGAEPYFRAQGTGDNEWFTPAEYIEAARRVLGAIDLDPASHPTAQQMVQAKQFFTHADDGLRREWHGRVWLNPPYGPPAIGLFVDRLIEQIEAGHTTAAIMLTHNYTDSPWFQQAATVLKTICFARKRVHFANLDGREVRPTQGQAFFYFGPERERFIAEFRPRGLIVIPEVSDAKRQPQKER